MAKKKPVLEKIKDAVVETIDHALHPDAPPPAPPVDEGVTPPAAENPDVEPGVSIGMPPGGPFDAEVPARSSSEKSALDNHPKFAKFKNSSLHKGD